MSLPDPGGRVQPRHAFTKTVHAWAAGQSVFGLDVEFLTYPEEAERLRGMWLARLAQLRGLGYAPLACEADHKRVAHCTWGLYGLDRGGKPCWRAGCPSCHGVTTALYVEDVLRVRDRNPGATLRLIQSRHEVKTGDHRELLNRATTPLDAGNGGYWQQASLERASEHTWVVTVSAVTANGHNGELIPRTAVALAETVARMRAYPLAHLDLAPEVHLDALRKLPGKHLRLSRRRGVFRLPDSASKLDDCRWAMMPKWRWKKPPAETYDYSADPVPGTCPEWDSETMARAEEILKKNRDQYARQIRRAEQAEWCRQEAAEEARRELVTEWYEQALEDIDPLDGLEDGPVIVVVPDGQPVCQVLEPEFEPTHHLTREQMLWESEMRGLEWVQGYEEFLEVQAAYWDHYWPSVHESGEVVDMTREEFGDFVQARSGSTAEDLHEEALRSVDSDDPG